MTCVKLEACFGFCVPCVSLAYGAICRRIPHVDVWYGDLCRRRSTCINVRRCTVMYYAVKPNDTFSLHARGQTYVAVCPRACEENANFLKAGNRALEYVGFMTQRAPHRPLLTGHHSNDLVPLPAGTIPDDDAVLHNVA